jgi:leucyl aminopeptidase
VSALGGIATGLFSNSDALAREILEAGERGGTAPGTCSCGTSIRTRSSPTSRTFRTPGSDCAVTAAYFLARFTKRYPWAHLDIAGTASVGGEDKGATGRPVALLSHFLVGGGKRAPAVRIDVYDRFILL